MPTSTDGVEGGRPGRRSPRRANPRRRRRCRRAAAAVVASLLAAATTHAAERIVHVDAAAAPGGDGTTWSSAHRFLQDGLVDAASDPADGVRIRVAAGVYRPDADAANPGGTGQRTATFDLPARVTVEGGWPAGGGEPASWDPDVHVTVLDGDLPLTDGAPAFHVVTIDLPQLEDPAHAPSLVGCTIRGGRADGTVGDQRRGGGAIVRVPEGVPHPVFRRCRFEANRATDVGGAILFDGALPSLADCVFVGNEAFLGGGAIAIVATDAADAIFANCRFVSNAVLVGWSFGGGGAIFAADCPNTFVAPRLSIVNSVFAGNTATVGPAAMGARGALPGSACPGFLATWAFELVNCTIVDHPTVALAGGDDDTWTLRNAIVWGGAVPAIGHPSATVEHAIVAGGWSEGIMVFDQDPAFVDVQAGDLRLSAVSPAVDVGDDAAIAAFPDVFDLDGDGLGPPGTDVEPTPDLDRNPRVQSAAVDLGAWERPCDGDGGGGGDAIDFDEVLSVIANWGACDGVPCNGDLDGDGLVGLADLLVVLAGASDCTSEPDGEAGP